MEILFLGVGEAFSEKANTSILVDGVILLDCGLSTVQQLFKAEIDFNEIKMIYISHLHADHCFGLPSFLVTCREESRKNRLQMIGPPGVEKYLTDLLHMAYRKKMDDLGFVVEIREAVDVDYEGYRIKFASMQHPVECKAVSIEKDGKKVTYTGDGSPTAEAKKLAEDSDLLIAEGYVEGIRGHSSMVEAAKFAGESNAKNLAVVHVSRKENPKKKLEEAGEIFPQIFIPEDLNLLEI
ncbi:MAG: MBL fold metallo-hydrolase [Candidatus Altiarchaeota archaeon]|nr:MBL fold metallo-hydrolase [Candidatus Altiarchaeota archaeon]